MSADLHAAVDRALDALCDAVSAHGLDRAQDAVDLWCDDAPEAPGEPGVPPEQVAEALRTALRDLAELRKGRRVCRAQLRPGSAITASWPADEPASEQMIDMIAAALRNHSREAAE